MPGPVSDSYDPEFGTGANAHDVAEAIQALCDVVGEGLGERQHIVGVVHGPDGKLYRTTLTERERRIIRFALERALDTI